MESYALDAARKLLEEARYGVPQNRIQESRRGCVIQTVAVDYLGKYPDTLQGLTEIKDAISQVGSGMDESTISDAKQMAFNAYSSVLKTKK